MLAKLGRNTEKTETPDVVIYHDGKTFEITEGEEGEATIQIRLVDDEGLPDGPMLVWPQNYRTIEVG